MQLDFEKYAMKGNEFLHQLEENLHTADRDRAARILKATFRVLRNHLTFEESLQLLAQLPMAIKAVYVDGWQKKDHFRIKNSIDFIQEIAEADGMSVWTDFASLEDMQHAVNAVIQTMNLYVSTAEIDQALNTLPKQVREILTLAHRP
ncbi:DUF2267 domain-containing protein [Chryseolinea lacunae]|uniref:DUF2267 domain-containing protein n=1 Tax=Chryseolinea lacunae TaxID=2801331 RepID=A0ABS1KP93_9BACT|nr:DUF2267 domain-containing protein [Chryseolinea lacunae]MBL0741043.1 DUF2267 domain-containing protein [Chryseolinea lacunae]